MDKNNEENHTTSPDSSKSTWVLVGLYTWCHTSWLGWFLATSQYVDRTLVLPEDAQLEDFVKQTDTSKARSKNQVHQRFNQPDLNTCSNPSPTRVFLIPHRSIPNEKIPEQTDGE